MCMCMYLCSALSLHAVQSPVQQCIPIACSKGTPQRTLGAAAKHPQHTARRTEQTVIDSSMGTQQLPSSVDFHLQVDLSVLGRGEVSVKTTLTSGSLKKPIGKALIAPFLDAFNKGGLKNNVDGVAGMRGQKKLAEGNVTAVTIDSRPVLLTQTVSHLLPTFYQQVRADADFARR